MIKLTTIASRGTLLMFLLITLLISLIGNIFFPGFMDGLFKWVIALFVGLWAVIFVYTTFINAEFGVKDYHSFAIKARFWELLLGKEKAKGFTRDVMKSGFGKFLGVVLMIMGIALIIISLYNLFY
ncbi:MAG: hypothetical protein NTX82_04395 [Candidatus Parcubacteria bacterium]|nr:hypothetical protein [Candidatus Parcubacteria bacterium]